MDPVVDQVGASDGPRTVQHAAVVAGNPARPVKQLDTTRPFRKREALFQDAEGYDEYLRRYDAFMLKENSVGKWLRSIILPSRGQ